MSAAAAVLAALGCTLPYAAHSGHRCAAVFTRRCQLSFSAGLIAACWRSDSAA